LFENTDNRKKVRAILSKEYPHLAEVSFPIRKQNRCQNGAILKRIAAVYFGGGLERAVVRVLRVFYTKNEQQYTSRKRVVRKVPLYKKLAAGKTESVPA